MGYIFSFLVALIVSALVIFIVGRLNLGLTVSGFGAAIIAALVIAIVGTIVLWLLSAFRPDIWRWPVRRDYLHYRRSHYLNDQ